MSAPNGIKGMMQKCWAQEPSQRPDMTKVVQFTDKFMDANSYPVPSADEDSEITSIKYIPYLYIC